MDAVKRLRRLDDPASSLPFVHTILSTLRREVDGARTRPLPRHALRAARALRARCFCRPPSPPSRVTRLRPPPFAPSLCPLLPLCPPTAGQSTLLGFVGTPWTLAAYAVEGKADKECRQTKARGAGRRAEGGRGRGVGGRWARRRRRSLRCAEER